MAVIFPATVSAIIDRLRAHGYSAYAVGGCIRDSLLGRIPNDWDITTSSLPERTAAIFTDPPFRVRIDNGLRHGTVTVFPADDPHAQYEVTTFRCDGTYSDYRRPDSVSFVTDLKEDLARRDFTVNAMAAAPTKDGGVEFHDPFGGERDLTAGILRCVGEPDRRFTEDALRILRGLRFAARYGFRIEADTAAAMHALAPLLVHIAPERIGTELSGFLAGKSCGALTEEFADILTRILPCCTADGADELLSRTEDTRIRLVLLCRNADESVLERELKRLAYTREIRDEILLLHRYRNAPLVTHRDLCRIADAFAPCRPDSSVYFALRRVLANGDPSIDEAEAKTRALYTPGICYSTATLAVTGRDLIAAGVAAGPALGEMLKKLTDAAIDGRVANTPEALLSYALIQKNSAPFTSDS